MARRKYKLVVMDEEGVVLVSEETDSYVVAWECRMTGDVKTDSRIDPALIAKAAFSKGQGIMGSVLAGIKRVGNGSSSFAP